MSDTIQQSESYETCVSELIDRVSMVESDQSETNITPAEKGHPNTPSSLAAQVEEDAVVGKDQLDVVEDHIEVAAELPTVELAKGEALGEIVPPLGHVHSYYSDPESDQELDSDNADENDPVALANHIRSLIETLASRSRPMPESNPSSTPHIPERVLRDSRTGQPMPFPDAAFLSDSELIAKLKNMMVMNGVTPNSEYGKSRGWRWKSKGDKKSVWAVLDSFKAPPAREWCADLPEHLVHTGEGNRLDTLPNSQIISDDSSVMMYFPLIPDMASKVELAKSSVVLVPPVGHGGHKLKKTLKKYRMYGTFGKRVDDENAETSQSWKFWKKKIASTSTQGTPTSKSSRSLAPHTDSEPQTDVKQRVWTPSTTKLSVQALWWGYRLFLPPPVLDILSDEELEATKRVAMITSALTWFFANIPITALPLPMQPALLMLQKLMPYLGYIGSLITWSWDTVKSFDTGHGVILSATWLLPVALIPGTWEAYDFPVQSGNPAGSEVDETQDPKLDFALRLPLPPSSTSLLSASTLSSHSTLSAFASSSSSLANSVPADATPRLSVATVITSPSPATDSAQPVSAVSLMTDICRSKSQDSFTLPAVPSNSLNGSSIDGASRLTSKASLTTSSSIASEITEANSSTQSSAPSSEIEVPEWIQDLRSPPQMSASASSASLILSPNIISDAVRAAEILRMLDATSNTSHAHSAVESVAAGLLISHTESSNNLTGQQENEEDEERDGEVQQGEGSEEDAETAEVHNVVDSEDATTLRVESDAAASQNKLESADLNGEADHANPQDSDQDTQAERSDSAQAQIAAKQTNAGGNQCKNINPQDSLRQEKENMSPSPSSIVPMVKTSSKSVLAKSPSANVRDMQGNTRIEVAKSAEENAAPKDIQSQPAKKEKRKSRSMAVVGGLWRFLTGSG
ncbi:hypothetical protein V5O48_003315 [Marasmius crinis-equi]|uniref:Uncharacterized protein n=1 Tax=Marasmius crinis-equi TaxID=585013 RepID=A0ABR3FUA9_9AGAR